MCLLWASGGDGTNGLLRCREELPRIAGPVCPLCGREKGSCRCGQRRRAYRRCVSPFYYEGPAKRGILRLKLYGKVYAAEGFAQAMAETVRREYEGIAFDALVRFPFRTVPAGNGAITRANGWLPL